MWKMRLGNGRNEKRVIDIDCWSTMASIFVIFHLHLFLFCVLFSLALPETVGKFLMET
jgi:hypothetical protein